MEQMPLVIPPGGGVINNAGSLLYREGGSGGAAGIFNDAGSRGGIIHLANGRSDSSF